MMNQYHEFMEKISKLVDVKFWNVDAILVDEVGYNKLKDLGYIGDNLGQFKIEKVFQEIAILSPNRRMGILSDGNLYKCPKILIRTMKHLNKKL